MLFFFKISSETEKFTAEKAIINIPVKMLQNGMVDFTPELPKKKQNAINDVKV